MAGPKSRIVQKGLGALGNIYDQLNLARFGKGDKPYPEPEWDKAQGWEEYVKQIQLRDQALADKGALANLGDEPVDLGRREFMKGLATEGALAGVKGRAVSKILDEVALPEVIPEVLPEAGLGFLEDVFSIGDLFKFPKIQYTLLDEYAKKEGYSSIAKYYEGSGRKMPSSVTEVYDDIFSPKPGTKSENIFNKDILDEWDKLMPSKEVWPQMQAVAQGGSKQDLKHPVLRSMYEELEGSGLDLDEIRGVFGELDLDLTTKWQASATKRGDW